MARRHRSYSLEFKRHVAQQYLSGEIPLARLARHSRTSGQRGKEFSRHR